MRAGQSHEPHEQQAEHYDQPDRMTREKASTIEPEWNNSPWIDFGFARILMRNAAG